MKKHKQFHKNLFTSPIAEHLYNLYNQTDKDAQVGKRLGMQVYVVLYKAVIFALTEELLT